MKKFITAILLSLAAACASTAAYAQHGDYGIPYHSQLPRPQWGANPIELGVDFNGGYWGLGGFTPWLTIRSSVPRHGGGSFIQFTSPTLDGVEQVAVTINAGLIDATPHKFGGDFEINIPVDGKMQITALTAAWEGEPAGLLSWPPGQMNIGGPNTYWRQLFLQESNQWPGFVCPKSIPTPTCIRLNNGGYAPVYR
jgi:hypothetical protein